MNIYGYDLSEEEIAFCRTLRYSEKIDKLEKRKEREKQLIKN